MLARFYVCIYFISIPTYYTFSYIYKWYVVMKEMLLVAQMDQYIKLVIPVVIVIMK